MIKIEKKKRNKKYIIFLNSFFGNMKLFFIDKIYILPKDIKVFSDKKNKIIFFETTSKSISLKFTVNTYFFLKKNKILLSYNFFYQKKSILNLYNNLIQQKIKGLLQEFKIRLILKGIGFKAIIEKKKLILKLGFSHNILISIPPNITIRNQSNILIFSSIDYIFLSQFVHYIRKYKKPEPYKGKGLLLKTEKILLKEGKKSKK